MLVFFLGYFERFLERKEVGISSEKLGLFCIGECYLLYVIVVKRLKIDGWDFLVLEFFF